jgi:hypothetical protein
MKHLMITVLVLATLMILTNAFRITRFGNCAYLKLMGGPTLRCLFALTRPEVRLASLMMCQSAPQSYRVHSTSPCGWCRRLCGNARS